MNKKALIIGGICFIVLVLFSLFISFDLKKIEEDSLTKIGIFQLELPPYYAREFAKETLSLTSEQREQARRILENG